MSSTPSSPSHGEPSLRELRLSYLGAAMVHELNEAMLVYPFVSNQRKLAESIERFVDEIRRGPDV